VSKFALIYVQKSKTTNKKKRREYKTKSKLQVSTLVKSKFDLKLSLDAVIRSEKQNLEN
jgi:hypothetical protein